MPALQHQRFAVFIGLKTNWANVLAVSDWERIPKNLVDTIGLFLLASIENGWISVIIKMIVISFVGVIELVGCPRCPLSLSSLPYQAAEDDRPNNKNDKNDCHCSLDRIVGSVQVSLAIIFSSAIVGVIITATIRTTRKEIVEPTNIPTWSSSRQHVIVVLSLWLEDEICNPWGHHAEDAEAQRAFLATLTRHQIMLSII